MSGTEQLSAVEPNKLELWVLDRLCRPVQRRIPEWVSPNMLSWLGHVAAWTTFILAASSSFLSREWGAATLVLASLSMLAQMILDNIDGMHARATGQCSRFGEFLDHWLDATHIPLTSAAMAMALRVDPWLLVGVQMTATMIYHSQLLHYHYKGQFIHPPTCGTVAQVGAAFWFFVLGPWFYFFPRELTFNWYFVSAFTSLAILTQLRQCAFYWRRLGRFVVHHLPYVLMAGAFSVLYLIGGMDWIDYVLLSVCVSFRITGSYVLYTVLGKKFNGWDYGIPAWAGILYISHSRQADVFLGAVNLHELLIYTACAYMVARNIVDTIRHYPEFRAADERPDAHAA